MLEPVQRIAALAWRHGVACASERIVPEETAVALTYNGSAYAVLMATPQDLCDFAIGFTITEGIAAVLADIESVEIMEHAEGIEARVWVRSEVADTLAARRRTMAGPTGCGLCGIESLSSALRPLPPVSGELVLTGAEIMTAMDALIPRQSLNIATRAVHAAAFWVAVSNDLVLREDVGRHNALDKVIGAMACDGIDAQRGALLLTSRVSVELIQKAAMVGVPVIIAVSAPTALAVRSAAACGITLVAVARKDGFEVLSHSYRIAAGETAAAGARPIAASC